MLTIIGMCNKPGSHSSGIPENWERQKYAGYKRKRDSTVKFLNSNKTFHVLFNNFSNNDATQQGPVVTQQFYGRLNPSRGTK